MIFLYYGAVGSHLHQIPVTSYCFASLKLKSSAITMKKDTTLEGNDQCSFILIGPNYPAAFDSPQNSVVQLGTDQQTPR